MTDFRPIDGWPGYRVGDDGSVWSCRTSHGATGSVWRELRGRPDRDGYLSVTLTCRGVRRTRKVAHLVLEAFIGPRPEDHESAHWPNTDPADNRLVNLRWATHADNSQDKVRGGTVARGVRHASAKLTEADVHAIRAAAAAGETGKALAARFSVSANQVSLIIRRRNWAHV